MEIITKRINLGLIGLGFIGMVHLKNCLRLKNAKVVAVADLSKKALNFARENGVKQLFTDYNTLLKQRAIDAVLISLPTHLHAPCAISAAEAGKHIFLEKPLARNPNEGRKIISMIKKNDVKLMVDYPLRFTKDFKDLKGKIERGVLGDIQTAHAFNIGAGPFFHRLELTTPRPVPEWWFDEELTGGGALIDIGSHMINLARWYFGEIKSIKAYLGRRFHFNLEDYAICIAKLESEVTALINVGWFSQKALVGIEVFGTVAHESSFRPSSNKVVTAIQLILGRTPKFFAPYMKAISYFVDCVKSDVEPTLSGVDALKDLEAIEQAYKNAIMLA